MFEIQPVSTVLLVILSAGTGAFLALRWVLSDGDVRKALADHSDCASDHDEEVYDALDDLEDAPTLLRLLADVEDARDRQQRARGYSTGDEVQTDFRRWALAIEKVRHGHPG
jgi:hypothetical protein